MSSEPGLAAAGRETRGRLRLVQHDASPPGRSTAPFRFGSFEIRQDRYELRRDGRLLHLEPKVFEVLAYLVAHRDRLVTKQELLDAVWTNEFVSESALSRAVRDARRALGESGTKEGWVQTVHGRGFCFADPAAQSGAPAAQSAPGIEARPSTIAKPALAVLPFDGAGDSDTAYLAEGIPETLIAALAPLAGLRVLPRHQCHRFRAEYSTPTAFARELGARWVLTGRLLVRGETLVVRVELTDCDTGAQIWGSQSRHEMADLFTVQEELASDIAARLRLRLSGEERHRLAQQPTQNGDALRLYLQGRYHWHKRSIASVERALACFEGALALDGRFALAEVGVADSYNILGFYGARSPGESFQIAKQAASRALALDPGLVPAHAALAYDTLYFDWDFAAAEEGFLRAAAIDETSLAAHHYYFNLLTAAGRFDEALARSDRTLDLDPLWVHLHAARGWILYFARRWDEALQAFATAEAMEPHYPLLHLWRGWTFERMGRLDDAVADLRAAAAWGGPAVESEASLARALALRGDRGEARRILDRLRRASAKEFVSAYEVALVELAMGRREPTLDRLEEALAQRSHLLVFAAVEPKLEPLRGDPRFETLLRRIGPTASDPPGFHLDSDSPSS